MSALLPADDQVALLLAETRVAVLDATRRVRSPKRSTRYRVTRNIVIASVAAIALTAGAIAVARAVQEQIDTNVVCYETADLDSTAIWGGTNPEMFDPVAMCETAWATDSFDDPQGGEDMSHPVPELIVCTRPDGVAGVFPLGDARSEDFCAALGLADWDSD
jgi:hypothetical protein